MLVEKAMTINALNLSANRSHLFPARSKPIVIGQNQRLTDLHENGIITGTVKEKGAPVSRRVFCYERKNGTLAATTTSDADGNYQFRTLALNPDYYVVSLDENGDKVQYNAVIQDLIRAKKVMT